MLKSNDIIYRLEIPNTEICSISEFPIPMLRSSLLINDILYLNTTAGLISVDIYKNQWNILRKFGGDTVIVDFNVSKNNRCVIYSLLTDMRGDIASNFVGILYEEYESGESNILYTAHKRIFHSLYWLDNKTIGFIERFNYSKIAKSSHSILMGFNEIFNIMKKEDKSVKNIGFCGRCKLDMHNDTLVFWYHNKCELCEKLDFLVRCSPISESILKFINVPFNILQPIPQCHLAIHHYKMPNENVIRLLNLSTGKMASFFIGDCVAYAFSNNKLLFRIKNRYKSSFLSWEKRPFIIIEVEDIHQEIRSVIEDLIE